MASTKASIIATIFIIVTSTTVFCEDVTFDYATGEASLLCSSISNSPTFFADSEQVHDDGGEKYSISGQTLTIKELKKADIEKTWSCRDLSGSSGSNVVFTKSVKPFLYQVDFLTVAVTQGSKTEFSCYLLVGTESTTSAPITWTWSKERSGGSITTSGSSRYEITTTTDTTQSTISINDVESTDAGEYYCKATNTHGSNSRNTKLIAKSKLLPLWPFLGSLVEIALLCLIIFGCQHYHEKNDKHKVKKA